MVVDPAPTIRVMLAAPAVVAFVASTILPGSRLVTVTRRLPAGAAAPRPPPMETCRSLPIVASPMLIGGAAFTAIVAAAAVMPGAPTRRVVLPTATAVPGT